MRPLDQIGVAVEAPELLEALRHYLRASSSGRRFATFQVEAATRIFAGLGKNSFDGTLVGAGTGSGKTLAFYIPALSWLASQVAESDTAGVRILALYPRNELLKDQFAEVYSQCRFFDDYLSARGKRKLSIGVFYGETPYSAKKIHEDWPAHGEGYRCPYLGCPRLDCAGVLVVRRIRSSARHFTPNVFCRAVKRSIRAN